MLRFSIARRPTVKQIALENIGGTFYAVDVTDFERTEQVLQSAVDELEGLHISVTTAGGGIGKRTLSKDGPHSLEDFRGVIRSQLSRDLQHQQARGHRTWPTTSPKMTSAASSSTPRPLPLSRVRSDRWLTPLRRRVSLGCASRWRVISGPWVFALLPIAPSLFLTGMTKDIPEEWTKPLTKDAAFPKRLGRPEEYAKLVAAIVENPMLNGQCLRLDAGQRFAPK